jgi:flavodoxin short chain
MKKLLVLYWSSSGNTELMAKSLAKGAEDAGACLTVKLFTEATAEMVKEAEALGFGCPAMGDEVLEESDVEPFISRLSKEDLAGKPAGLFGSYDWGDGQWMRDWVKRMKDLGAAVDGAGVIAQLEPTEDTLKECYELGKRLVS